MRVIIAISLVSVLLTAVACEKEPNPEYIDFIFELPFSITPIKDTFAIGDTLWLEANFPDTIKDRKSDKYYYVPPTFDFKTSIGFHKLVSNQDGISRQPGFAQAFEIINRVGKVEKLGPTFGDLRLVYENNHYKARVGIIPRQKGVVAINFLDGWLAGRINNSGPDIRFIDLGKTSEGAEQIPVLRNIYHTINGGDTTKTNFSLFRQHCRAFSVEQPDIEGIYYEQKATFTFVVTGK